MMLKSIRFTFPSPLRSTKLGGDGRIYQYAMMEKSVRFIFPSWSKSMIDALGVFGTTTSRLELAFVFLLVPRGMKAHVVMLKVHADVHESVPPPKPSD